jgi:hypothetical protein
VYRGLLLLFVGVATLASILPGCGSSDDGEQPLTKVKYVAQGDAICAKAEKRKAAALKIEYAKLSELKSPSEAEVGERLTQAAVPPIKTMTAELSELQAPSGDQDRTSAIVVGFEKATEEVEADPSGALSGDNPFATADKLAASYGFKICSTI